jgi:hypothetical protein
MYHVAQLYTLVYQKQANGKGGNGRQFEALFFLERLVDEDMDGNEKGEILYMVVKTAAGQQQPPYMGFRQNTEKGSIIPHDERGRNA